MTDRKFQQLIDRTAAAQNKFHHLLQAAESEYERRFGANPSDVDDDGWIDAMTGSGGSARGLTLVEVEEGARMSGLNDKVEQPAPTQNDDR